MSEPSQLRRRKQDQPVINIAGEKVLLGPHRRENLSLYIRWVNDFEVLRTLAVPLGPMSAEAEEQWYQRTVIDSSDVHFTIYERSTTRPIGSTALHHVDFRHRTAEFGILIGEKDCWGKGYGTETTVLMLDYGFIGLGLHNILLEVYSFNERAFRAYLRAGFKEIGRRREALRRGKTAFDLIMMDCLSTEFEGSVLSYLLPDKQF